MITFNFVNTSVAQRYFLQIQPCNCVLSAFENTTIVVNHEEYE